jgi:hypothetical protein
MPRVSLPVSPPINPPPGAWSGVTGSRVRPARRPTTRSGPTIWAPPAGATTKKRITPTPPTTLFWMARATLSFEPFPPPGPWRRPAPTWVLNLTYQGTAGVGLERSWNINQIPLSIALGGNRALQDTVFQAQQNYLLYPQFGNINLLSNFNHNTWHSGNITVEKRYGRGLTLNASFNLSKSLSNDDGLAYYDREGKARTPYDQEKAFGAFVTYELPVGKGQRWLNRGGVVNALLGGWKVDMSENILSGIPLTVGYSGSPNKYLTTARVNAVVRLSRRRSRIGTWVTVFQPRRRTLTST